MKEGKILGIDVRSLTMFRQIIALIYLFLVFVLRVSYFEYYSVDEGPFSNDAMSLISNAPLLTTIVLSDFHLKLFILLATIPGITLFLGIYPSISSFISMGMYTLLARRFFPYYYGVDEVLVSILFVMGIVYLINNTYEKKYISISENPFILLLLVQIVLIYWLNGLNKTHISWWKGEAVSMTLFNVLFNKPLGVYLLKFEILNKALSYFTLLFEITFPVWIFSKYKPAFFRILAAVFIICFHWGISIFVDVTLYKYFGLAFFFLLMPGSFWNQFALVEKILVKDFNYRISVNERIDSRVLKIFAIALISLLTFKAITASVYRQNDYYKSFKSEKFKNVLKTINSRNLSPFKQSWTMFAPSPPQDCGYFAFEYSDENQTIKNINLYGTEIPFKNISYYHPFHMAMVFQYAKVAKGFINNESEFVLFNLFEFEIRRDMDKHPDRKLENYQLILYQQKYEDFKREKAYNFKRIVLASYD